MLHSRSRTYPAPRQHTHMACGRSPLSSYVRTSPTRRGAAHNHVGDLTNVPCSQTLVERARVSEHFLRRASTRTQLVAAPRAQLCVKPCNIDARPRRTCMYLTWPTSQASKGWLKELASLNIYCATSAHALTACGCHSPEQLCVCRSPVCVQEPCDVCRSPVTLTQGGGAPPCW